MAVILKEIPKAVVFNENSYWNAVHHPIIVKLQRVDQSVAFKYQNPGMPVVIKTVGAPIAANVGDRIRYFQPNGENYTWTITAISGSNITTDGTIPGTFYGGTVNYIDGLTGYYIEADVLDVDASQTLVKLATLDYKVDIDGICEISSQEILRSLVQMPNGFNYDQINKAVLGESGKFVIRYREFHSGTEQNETDTQILYWTNSAKQVGDVYGANMADYVPTIDATREDPDKAKFLSVFDKPTYFTGFPFSLSFIYSDNLRNKQLSRVEEHFDLNGDSVLGGLSTLMEYSERFFLNRLMIQQGYSSTVKEIDVWIESGDTITESPVDGDSNYSDGTIFEPLIEIEYDLRPIKPTM